MKKVAYITLIAAFVFGVQPQEAFSATDVSFEMEKGGKGEARINFDQASDILLVEMTTNGKVELALVTVFRGSTAVAKESVKADRSGAGLEIDLSGMPAGTYSVTVVSESIDFKSQFRNR